ncbi:hypothetical protein [Halostella litorea]|uniref:hypothetical protein n=1 Tax=Halostella litorea TaxID=2528831 RepID=UPI001091E8A8|nr:hypothetical protein [Halostella litorea]
MSYSPPSPPQEIPDDVVEMLNKQSPEVLKHIAQYGEELAEHREREARLAEQDEEEQIEDRPGDHPDDVPSKATITIKKINDNRYYYWQWRDGDRIRSKYKRPVNPDE